MSIGTSRGYHLLIGKALPPPPLKTGEFHGPQARARGRVPVRFLLSSLYMSVILKQLVCFSFINSLCVVTCAGKMDSDLDNIIESGGAKRSKRPRAGSLKSDRLGKGPRGPRKPLLLLRRFRAPSLRRLPRPVPPQRRRLRRSSPRQWRRLRWSVPPLWLSPNLLWWVSHP